MAAMTWYMWLAELVFLFMINLVRSCDFPQPLQSRKWIRHINLHHSTKTLVYFWSDIMETQNENTSTAEILGVSQNYCLRVSKNGRYIMSSQRNLQSAAARFSCVEFKFRSKSVVQLKMSDASKYWTIDICDDARLRWQPWLLVAYDSLEMDYVSCPISGGFDMKIIDKNGLEHVCNSNDVPMRFESNCFTGEGLTFNLQDRNCIGDLPMSQLQKATCVTSWHQDGYVVTVVRKVESLELWCLLVPLQRTTPDSMSAVLFMELSCATQEVDRVGVQYYTLQLNRKIQHSLCEDQHQSCHRLPCKSPFIKQCLKTCGQCDPNIFPTACDFPFYAQGQWLINSKHGRILVNISANNLQMDNYGQFDCVTWSNYPGQLSGMYTSVSLFKNGCTPKYTCLKFRKMGLNTLGMAVSQSKAWPVQSENIRRLVCNSQSFDGDPPPFHDTYRTYSEVFKPVVTLSNTIKHQPCILDSSYKLILTDKYSGTLTGALYKDCNNASNIRTEIYNVSRTITQDFTCIGLISSKYWEKIILLQNHADSFDTRCLIFSEVNSSRVIVIESAECDQLTWMYVDAGIRTPILDMAVKPDHHTCKTIQNDRHVTDKDKDMLKSFGKNTHSGGRVNGNNITQSTKRSTHDVYNIVDYSSITSNSDAICSDITLYSLVMCLKVFV